MNVARNKHLLLWTSLATLVLLVGAALRENVASEWRVLQRGYRARLAPEAAREFKVQLRQLYVPAVGAVDRCVSCHVGMAPGESGIDGDPIYARHPRLPHDPADFGCVICHGGQGRATRSADAHGAVHHWPEPMIPGERSDAGCGACHTHLAVPNHDEFARGAALFERLDCLACHAVDGRGGTLRPGQTLVTAPDLSLVGASGFDPEWYARHIAHRDSAVAAAAPAGAAGATGPWGTSMSEIGASDRAALAVFLRSRVGAPGLMEAKTIFHSLGCRGCHKVNGVGGDDGPDLTRVGERDPGQLDFTHVPGERTLASWFAEHFRAPAVVVPGSAMPALGLAEDDISALTTYMLSLRRADLPGAYWPADRIQAERFGAREFSTDGATLYGTFCAACHGQHGEGMRYPGAQPFPAIGNPDFLGLASDSLLTATVRHGRPGRRMPAWGDGAGGLRPGEIAAVVAHVRAMGGVPAPVETRPARWVAAAPGADPATGGRLFAANCARCHGAKGEGGEGPMLANPVLLASATDTYLVETIRRGRRGTAMPAFTTSSTIWRLLSDSEIESIVAFIRTWEVRP